MPTLLATVEQLAARVGEPIETPAEIALAETMLEYASNQVLLHGSASWAPETLPGLVRSIVIEAAGRGYQHPAGLQMERADSVTFNVDEEWLRSAELTDAQIKLVRRAATKRGTVRSLSTSRSNRLVARSDRGARGWSAYKVPTCPCEEVPIGGRGSGIPFLPCGECDC